MVDELSLCTTQDFHQILNPIARLGRVLWLLGDCRNQLLSIGDSWHGTDLARDLTDTWMLQAAVGSKTLLLPEGRRAEPELFSWISSMTPGGERDSLAVALPAARLAFPTRGRPAASKRVPVPPHPHASDQGRPGTAPPPGPPRRLFNLRGGRCPWASACAFVQASP